MPETQAAAGTVQPRWDGRRVLFELRHDGADVSCAISPDALRELSPQRCFKPADLLRCFTTQRPRIEAAARRKLHARPSAAAALLTLWTDDVEDPAPAG